MLVSLVVTLAIASLMAGSPTPGTAKISPGAARPPLFKDSRQSLAIARAEGRTTVTLLVAAAAGRTAEVEQQATALGSRVRYRNDEISYLRIEIPIERVEAIISSPHIEAVAMDVYAGRADRLAAGRESFGDLPTASGEAHQPDEGQPSPSPAVWPPEPGDYPLRHPYSAIKEVGADEMLADHPTWDGRGVTIAILDGNFDLLLPEFETAYALDGSVVPKVADFLNATDPETDAEFTPQWVDMRTVVETHDRRVSHMGKRFTTPRDGTFRIGLFSKRAFDVLANTARIDKDVNRSGNPRTNDGLFAVLWDETTNDVWVDTDGDFDFTHEEPMTDYVRRQDVGVFGQDDPMTSARETIGFTVQTDVRRKVVSINLGISSHPTAFLGAVAGNREPNGRFNGLAPGARLVSIMYRSAAHALIEALVTAFAHPLVDLVVLEQNVAIATDPYWLADGRHPISIVAQRLIDRYGKLLFVPGSNSPGLGIVGEEGLAPGAVSVGAYQHKESYRVNYGFVPEHDDNMHVVGLSHGPSGTGALKPDLLASSGLLSTDLGYRKGAVQRGLYRLPPGYSIAGGTSTAAPMAAAAAALVVSAAKQLGLSHDAPRLKAALTGSARHIPRLMAHEQGNGLVQVGGAIQLLEKLQSAPRIRIVSRAPVKTRLSHLLATPNEGEGFYEREGWAPGDHGERTLTFTRTTGPGEPMTFAFRWQGNDGTFSAPSSVTLPLNVPVAVPLTIAVAKAGVHSALLVLEHSSVPAPVHRVLVTVVAAHRFDPATGHTVTSTVKVPRPGDRGMFVDVPPGASGLLVKTEGGTVRLRFVDSSRGSRWAACFAGLSAKSPSHCAIANPAPGVWEINLCADQDAFEFDPETPRPVRDLTITVTARLLGFDVSTPGMAQVVAPDTSAPVSLAVRNTLGEIDAAASTDALGSAFRTRRPIAAGEQHLYEVTVPPGTTAIAGQIAAVGDSTADLDLYLLDCTRPEPPPLDDSNKAPPAPDHSCRTRASAADPGMGGRVEVEHPRPGRWVLAVDAFHLTSGRVEYDYLDLFAHARFGMLAVADTVETRNPGRQWTVKGNAWISSLPEAPRVLYGRITITSPAAYEHLTLRDGETSLHREWRFPLGTADLGFDASPTSDAREP